LSRGGGRLIDWALLENLIGELADGIKASGFRPDVVIGLGRRGWVFARLLSDHLAVSDLITLHAEASINIGRISTLELKGRRVLIALDVEEAGSALKGVLEGLEALGPSEVRTATPLLPRESEITPDYYGHGDGGVLYPWELHRGSVGRRPTAR